MYREVLNCASLFFMKGEQMDIEAINEAIEELENSDTTVKNVQELACLYIVRQNINHVNLNVVARELDDILPAYNNYCDIKRKYQLKEITEEGVIDSMKYLCVEICEFIDSLYSHTDMRKERKQLNMMLESLYNRYVENI